MLNHFGFECRRKGGSHRVYTRGDVREILNLQPLGNGKAKPYQVKQVRGILINCNIL